MANIFFAGLFTMLLNVAHPFFVSVVEINHNVAEKKIETSVRIFTDDFEKTLQAIHPEAKIDLFLPTNKQQMNQWVAAYIVQKLSLQVDDKAVVLEYVGYEIQKESVWVYFETSNIANFRKVTVQCNLLYDYQPSQTNIIHVKAHNTTKSASLTQPQTIETYVF